MYLGRTERKDRHDLGRGFERVGDRRTSVERDEGDESAVHLGCDARARRHLCRVQLRQPLEGASITRRRLPDYNVIQLAHYPLLTSCGGLINDRHTSIMRSKIATTRANCAKLDL